MNLNKKIAKFQGDGIPAYNERINQLIDAVNWLAGIRTINGKQITESDQGPIIDLSQANNTQAVTTGPSDKDPDGNPAGWLKVLVLNTDSNSPDHFCLEQWIWTSNTIDFSRPKWLVDPNGNIASWIVGSEGALWGTGAYPSGGTGPGNFQQATTIYTGSKDPDGSQNYRSPSEYTSNPSKPPIVIPASAPAFYLKAFDYNGAPGTYIGGATNSSNPEATITWTLEVFYEGNKLLTYTGSNTETFNGPSIHIQFDPTGWVYDPQNLSGYSHGSGMWIWKYNGSISSNPNPTVIQRFTFTSTTGTAYFGEMNVIFLTG